MRRAHKRLLLLDYDGTLVPANNINCAPPEEVLAILQALCADARNSVYIISGRCRAELAAWFAPVVRGGPLPLRHPRRSVVRRAVVHVIAQQRIHWCKVLLCCGRA